MGTLQTFKTTDVLRLEVEDTPTGLVNQLINPPDTSRLQFPDAPFRRGLGWGWVDDDEKLSADFRLYVPSGQAETWVLWAPIAVGATFLSEDWAHEPGEYAAAYLIGALNPGEDAIIYARLWFEWLDATGTVIGSSAASSYVRWTDLFSTSGAAQSLGAQLAPAGTVRARLRVTFYADDHGTEWPGGGPSVYWRNATVAKAATSAELSGLGYIPAEPNFTDVIGPTHTITVNRSALNVGTLTADILDASIDPSQSTLVRPGKRVRLMALDNDTATWRPLFDGKIQRGRTTYDPTRTDVKRARVTLTAVDAVAQLSQVSKTQGVTVMGESWRVLQGAHVPYWINTTSWPANTLYTTDSRPLLDQIGILRDSALGYAWVDRKGLLQIWEADDLPTSVAATLDEATYSDLVVDYDTDRCINVVNVKLRRLNGAEEVEVLYGPFADQASVDQWGAHKADFTVVGITDSLAAAEAYAEPILAANATPAVRINSVDIPIRDAADIVAGKAFLDLYDLVTLDNTNAGINEDMRPTGLEHRIEDGKWMLHLEFTAEGGVAPPQQNSSSLSVVTGDTGWLRPGDVGGPAWGVGWGDWSDTANAYVAMKRTGTNVKVAGLGRRTSGSGTTMLILPPGCRLANGKNSWHPCEVNNAPGVCVVDGSGNVLIQSAVTNGQHVAVFIDFDTDQP
jgi:hypothetical protein